MLLTIEVVRRDVNEKSNLFDSGNSFFFCKTLLPVRNFVSSYYINGFCGPDSFMLICFSLLGNLSVEHVLGIFARMMVLIFPFCTLDFH